MTGSTVYSAGTSTPTNFIQVTDSTPTEQISDVVWYSANYPLGISGPLASEQSLSDVLEFDFLGPDVLSTSQLPEAFPAIGSWSTDSFVAFGAFSNIFLPPDNSFSGNILSISENVCSRAVVPSAYFGSDCGLCFHAPLFPRKTESCVTSRSRITPVKAARDRKSVFALARITPLGAGWQVDATNRKETSRDCSRERRSRPQRLVCLNGRAN